MIALYRQFSGLLQRCVLPALCISLAACHSLGVRAPALLPEAIRDHPDQYVVVTVANQVQSLSMDAASSPRGYIGGANYSISSAARALSMRIADAHHLHAVAAWPIAALGVHCLVYQVTADADRQRVLHELAQDQRVESAQALENFTTQSNAADGAYNDPYAELQTNLTTLAIPQAQRLSKGSGVTIAVIDTGMDSTHADLQQRIVAEHNFVDANLEQFHRDTHGTAVAGLIGAVANNRIGIVGIAPAAHIIALKACWYDSSAAGARCNSFTLAQALATAIDAHADIVNLSLAGPADPLLTRLVRMGQTRGMIFVGAVPSQHTGAIFPADVADVIAVEASSAQAATNGHVAAPAQEVFTLTPGGHYDVASGSSMAAAQISAIIALMRSRNHSLTAAQARTALLNSTHQQMLSTGDVLSTVNACAALAAQIAATACDQSAALSQR